MKLRLANMAPRIATLFSAAERKVLGRLKTPARVQDFLETLPVNFEEGGETLMSPRRVLRAGKAHCFEGALLAAAAFWFHGEKPLILDLKTLDADEYHVVALFRRFGRWGAISHTNHAVLRFREPVYRTVRELTMSYFHEYFLNTNGKKTLRSYSRPLDLSRIKQGEWVTAEEDVWYIDEGLERARHYPILTPPMIKTFRRADPIEIKAGTITQWPRLTH